MLNLLLTYLNEPGIKSDGDLVEVFVDLFSGAVMMDTEYASKSPILPDFTIEECQFIRNYFVQLMGKSKYKDRTSSFEKNAEWLYK